LSIKFSLAGDDVLLEIGESQTEKWAMLGDAENAGK